MLKRFLKRFEKLENIPQESLLKSGLKISKRFERLEVGDKIVELTIADTILREESAPDEVEYYVLCPVCGAQNHFKNQACVLCKRSLEVDTLSGKRRELPLLKKCSCGAVNQKGRRNCWICGKDFFLENQKKPQIDTDNVIILNINGKEYKSTDTDLPLDIRLLMEKIRREGYRKELIDEWIEERNRKLERQQDEQQDRLQQIQLSLIMRTIGLIIFLVFILLQLSMCWRYVIQP